MRVTSDYCSVIHSPDRFLSAGKICREKVCRVDVISVTYVYLK